MDAEHRWLAKTETGAGGRPASVEKGLGRDHFSFSYSQAIVYCVVRHAKSREHDISRGLTS